MKIAILSAAKYGTDTQAIVPLAISIESIRSTA